MYRSVLCLLFLQHVWGSLRLLSDNFKTIDKTVWGNVDSSTVTVASNGLVLRPGAVLTTEDSMHWEFGIMTLKLVPSHQSELAIELVSDQGTRRILVIDMDSNPRNTAAIVLRRPVDTESTVRIPWSRDQLSANDVASSESSPRRSWLVIRNLAGTTRLVSLSIEAGPETLVLTPLYVSEQPSDSSWWIVLVIVFLFLFLCCVGWFAFCHLCPQTPRDDPPAREKRSSRHKLRF
jgi:hypothetical protein